MWDLIFEVKDHEFEEEENIYEMSVNSRVAAEEEEDEEEDCGNEAKEWDPLGKYVDAVYKKTGAAKKEAKIDLSWVEKVKGKETYFVLVNQSGRTIK